MESEAFEEVYRRYFQDVYRYLLALCRNEPLAEELTQETFFKTLEAIDGFRGQRQLWVWLCQIARNAYFTAFQRQRRFAPPQEEAAGGGLEADLLDRDVARRLHVLLHALEEPYKEVFSLRAFGELPFAQIAALFGKSESWARVTYFRARQKLKEGME